MEYLSLRIRLHGHSRLHFVWSLFVDNDYNKRGQTSRPVVRAEIQTSCHFEGNICYRSYLIWVVATVAGMLYLRNHLITFWCGYIVISLSVLISTFSYLNIF